MDRLKHIVIRWTDRWRAFWRTGKIKSDLGRPLMSPVVQAYFIKTNGNGANGHTGHQAPRTLRWKFLVVGVIGGLLLCFIVFGLLASRWNRISTGDANNHIGEMEVVVGIVSEVHVTRRGTVLIDMDGRYPNEQFTAVWFAPSAPVAQLENLDGKRISVRGKISTYQGRPEIILHSMSQIGD